MEYKAHSFIEINHSCEEYRQFLLKPFTLHCLYSFNENSNCLFVGWKCTEMVGWHKFIDLNNHDNILEFFPSDYKIKINKKIYTFPLPDNIDQFIVDCKRVGLYLFWNKEKMDNSFKNKCFLNEVTIEEYYKDLLSKIKKENIF